MNERGGPVIALRAATEADEHFLYKVYASTREEELAATPWDRAQKDAFLAMQFSAQHRYYHATYPHADYSIILREGEAVGRLYVDRRADAIELMDIALLPAQRNGGIGGRLLAALLDEAARAGKPVDLYVEPGNRARRLYERLGFVKASEHGFYWFMVWRPPTASRPGG